MRIYLMSHYKLTNFDAKAFIATYWQKKPVILKGAIDSFIDPIDENDLAGLALEEGMDSRIISRCGQQWTMAQGPFNEFENYCKDQWTLLVQGVEHLIQDTQPLLNLFSFIPNWRIDDLMVSYSVAGAGVGPHLDQYDVFIIQGKGKRRWQVGERGQYETIYPHPKLTQIEGFDPIIDEVLEPGDIIYIPPGFPHNGVAENECMNYSIGFRAPDQRQLFENIADFMLDSNFIGERYQDPAMKSRKNPAQINESEINATRDLLKEWINSDAYTEFFVRVASYNQVETQPFSSEEAYLPEDIAAHLTQGGRLTRLGGVKPVYLEENAVSQKDTFTFYIEKNAFHLSRNIQGSTEQLLATQHYDAQTNNEAIHNKEFQQLLTTLINLGYWYFD